MSVGLGDSNAFAMSPIAKYQKTVDDLNILAEIFETAARMTEVEARFRAMLDHHAAERIRKCLSGISLNLSEL